MMKRNLFVVLALAIQYSMAQPTQDISHRISLTASQARGSMGVSVVWNSAEKRYYSAVSGGQEKLLLLYDEQGKLNHTPYHLEFDPGALWFESGGTALGSSASGIEGLYKIHLRSGLPAFTENVYYAIHNPVCIGTGAWVSRKKEVWFYHDKTVYRFKIGRAKRVIPIALDIADFDNELNVMSMIYTGIKKREIGLYDYGQNRILLFNAKTGRCSYTLNIKQDGHENLRPLCGDFSYANGIYWLFDRETGIWHGYN